MSRSGTTWPWTVAVALALAAGEAAAQEVARVRAGVAARGPGTAPSQLEDSWIPAADRFPPAAAPLASAVLPGLGQAMLGQHRMVVYLAAEGYFWSQYVVQSREYRRQRNAYRTLARNVARYSFSRTGPEGSWQYYEAMGGDFIESGAFSLAEGGATVPETDPETFNGDLWIRAQRLQGIGGQTPPPSDPAYQRALAFYEARAVPANLRWSWRNALLERDLFKRAIGDANDSFRRATMARGILIANHLLSAIDAFAAVRLSAPVAPDGTTRFTVTLPLPTRR